MYFGAPQILLLVLIAISIGVHLAKHGEHRDDEYNFFLVLFASVVEIAILYWGGFFTCK